MLKSVFQIFLIVILLGQTVLLKAGDPVFRHLDNGDFDRLDEYFKEHDINALYGNDSITLLIYSILNSKNRVTHYLIDQGADVNQYINGKSPLMHAAEAGMRKKVAILVSYEAEINALDSVHNTSLIYAARYGDLKTVKYLIRHGAALNHQNKERFTAYDESVRHHHVEISKYLRNIYEMNLPNFHDGPYVRWKGKRRIRAFYMVHDSLRQLTIKRAASFRTDSDPFLMKGFSKDSLDYLLSKFREIPPDQILGVQNIMVIGDIHGGYDSLFVFLKNNGVMDDNLDWTWGDGHLVFLGDIFDRGDKVTEALWLIYRLEGMAAKSGGAVHLILGNHEIMVLTRKEIYIADKYRLMSDNLNISYSGLFNKRTVLGQWLRSRNTMLKINDHLFVHAGLSPDILRSGLTMHDINNHVRFYLNHPDRESYGEISRRTILGVNGPFWYRGYIENNHVYMQLPESTFDEILTAFKAGRIFIGHTNVDRITPLYSNRVFAMDVPFYSNRSDMQGIIIENGVMYRVNSYGGKKEFR
jgi:hypothetical protein